MQCFLWKGWLSRKFSLRGRQTHKPTLVQCCFQLHKTSFFKAAHTIRQWGGHASLYSRYASLVPSVHRTHKVTRIVKTGRAQTHAHPHSCGLPPPAWMRHPPRPPVKQPHWRPTGTAQLPLNTKPQPVLLWNKSVVHRMALLIDPIYRISMYIQRSAEVSTLTQKHKAHKTFGTKKKNKRRNNRLFSWYVICWFLFTEVMATSAKTCLLICLFNLQAQQS